MNKLIRNYISLLALCLFLTNCANKEKAPEAIISGEDSKSWVAKTEYDAMGDKEKLSAAEKEEEMTFFRNGKFSMSSAANTESGTWSYNEASKELALVFEGSSVSENFDVSEMKDSRLTLVAGDGSKMILQSK